MWKYLLILGAFAGTATAAQSPPEAAPEHRERGLDDNAMKYSSTSETVTTTATPIATPTMTAAEVPTTTPDASAVDTLSVRGATSTTDCDVSQKHPGARSPSPVCGVGKLDDIWRARANATKGVLQPDRDYFSFLEGMSVTETAKPSHPLLC